MGELRVIAKPAYRGHHRNPYTTLLYRATRQHGLVVDEFTSSRLLRGSYDVWHLHWPEHAVDPPALPAALLGLLRMVAQLAVARLRRVSVVWTVHNLHGHDPRHPHLERLLKRLLVRSLDGYITLTAAGRRAAEATFPALGRRPHFRIPHGHYRETVASAPSRAGARAALGLPDGAGVVAYAGLIREYKNVPALITAFRALPDPDALLLVSGELREEGLRTRVTSAAGDDPRVRLDLRFLEDVVLQRYLAAADLVVLPFSEVLNSGSALLALSLDRPILVPDKGAMAELAAVVGPAWVRLYRGHLTPVVLEEALRWAWVARRPARAPLEAFDWSAIGADTAAAFASLRRSGAQDRVGAPR